jgi:hypothetical protein
MHTIGSQTIGRLFLAWVLVGLLAWTAQFASAQVPDGIISVTISPDGTRLLVGGTNGLLKVISATTGQDVLVIGGLDSTIFSTAWSPDGSHFAVSYVGDSTLRVYNAASGQLVSSRGIMGLKEISWSVNNILSANRDLDTLSDLFIYQGQNLALVCSVPYGGILFDAEWIPGSSIVVIGGTFGMYAVDVSQNCASTAIGSVDTYGHAVTTVAVSADGSLLAVGRLDEYLEIRRTSDWNVIRTTDQGKPFDALAWTADGQYLVHSSYRNTPGIFVVRAADGVVVNVHPLAQAGRIGTGAIAFSADGTRLYYGDGTTVMNVPVIAPPPATPTPTPTPTTTPVPASTLTVGITLGSRPVSGIIFNVVLAQPGVVRRDLLLTADAAGVLTLPAVPYGAYTLWVKHPQALARSVEVTVGAPSVSAGGLALPLGDVNADNQVNVTDFTLLAAAFGVPSGGVGFDPRADLNADGVVNVSDFTLLATAFGQAGAPRPGGPVVPLGEGASTAAPPELTSARVRAARVNNAGVRVGDTFDVLVRVGNASASASQGTAISQLDGAETVLRYDPARLRVEQITAGTGFPLTLLQEVDNASGRVRFAAGTLGQPVSGEFTLFTVRFRAMTSGLSSIGMGDTPALLTLDGLTVSREMLPIGVVVIR